MSRLFDCARVLQYRPRIKSTLIRCTPLAAACERWRPGFRLVMGSTSRGAGPGGRARGAGGGERGPEAGTVHRPVDPPLSPTKAHSHKKQMKKNARGGGGEPPGIRTLPGTRRSSSSSSSSSRQPSHSHWGLRHPPTNQCHLPPPLVLSQSMIALADPQGR